MPEAKRQPLTFEFVSEHGAWSGTPLVSGHEILSAQSIAVKLDAGEIPVVTLDLIVPDALKLVLAKTMVRVSDETREALIAMGWTPPADEVAP